MTFSNLICVQYASFAQALTQGRPLANLSNTLIQHFRMLHDGELLCDLSGLGLQEQDGASTGSDWFRLASTGFDWFELV